MKKIEKILILKDFDFINNELNTKNDKLKDIVSFFMDEEPEIIKTETEEIKKEEDIKNTTDEEEIDENEEFQENEQPEQQSDENDELILDTSNKSDIPKDIKTIYRKIVMITHPDKIKNSNNYDYLLDLYKKSVIAKDTNDIAELIFIAFKLNINDIYEIEDCNFDTIKNKISDLKNKSKNIENNAFWIWYHSEDKLLKRMMVEQISKIRNG